MVQLAEAETSERVHTVLKTPMMKYAPPPTLLPSRMTVAEALTSFCQDADAEPERRQAALLLGREMAGGVYFFLAISQSGEIQRIEPSTRLSEIATTREIRTTNGIEKMAAASIEVSAYAKVAGL
jgi:hypothetical protein